MAHPSQNPRRYFDDPEDENEISLAFQLAAASAAGQRHGRSGAPSQASGHHGHPSPLAIGQPYPGHPPPQLRHRPLPPHPHHNHPAMLSNVASTPGLPPGFFHTPSLNSGLASAIVAAEYQRQQREASQLAAARMNGIQPYILGFPNYAHHAPAPPPPHSPSPYLQHQHPQPPQLGAFLGMGAMVGGASPLSPELSTVPHSAAIAQEVLSLSTPSSAKTANPVTASLAAVEPTPTVAAAEGRNTVTTASTPNLTTTNAKSDNYSSPARGRTIAPRPLLPTPKWFGASTPLGVFEDKFYLSELQCVLRSEFVEAFGTTQSDTVLFINGRNKTIVVGQVGIRCKHCASISSNTTTTGDSHPPIAQHAVLYPSCIGGIYNIVQQMYRLHFEQCQYVPEELKARVSNLKDSHTSNRGGRKQYWIDSAKRIGLIDTLFGIHFGRDPKDPLPPLVAGGGSSVPNISDLAYLGGDDNDQSISNEREMKMSPEYNDPPSLEGGDTGAKSLSVPAPADDVEYYPLVTPDEKHLVADYLFLALEQMQPCNLMESDRVGCYKGRRTGFPGLACKHCVGQAGCGRYFPASEASLSQTTTSQTIINHVRNCRRCPMEVRKQLEIMRRAKHCPAYKKTDKPKHGGRKVIFRRLWCRIQRIPLPSPGTTLGDDTETDLPIFLPNKEEKHSEVLEKKKRKMIAESFEKDNPKSAKWSLEHHKAGHAHDNCPDDTIEQEDVNHGVVGAPSSAPDRVAKTASVRNNSKTRIAYQGRTPLARGDDSSWLSEADCFIRQEIVEVFTAQEEDLNLVGHPEMGQVGVRCFYCAENKAPQDRDKGHAIYPSVVAAIQQAVSDLQTRHIADCNEIPDDLRMSLKSMKNHDEKHLGDTAQYWIDAANELGLYDSHEGHGIYFFRNPLDDSPADEIDIEKNDNESTGSVLVPKENRAKCTDLMLLLLKQFEPCQFNESDRKSSRNRDRALGYPGLSCIHCKVKRYFPLTEKKLQDSLSLMTTHIENCFHAPLEVKASLCYLQHRSLMQKYKLAGQWKFAFLKGVWNRLHQNYKTKDSTAESELEAAASTINAPVQGLIGKGRPSAWRREKIVLASKNHEPVEEEVDAIIANGRDNLSRFCNDDNNDNSNSNNDEQERHNTLTDMKHLIKAAALWLSERDAENDARARGGGKSKGMKKR